MAFQFDLDSIDPEEIGRLMELLALSDVEECEIEQGTFGLLLRRGSANRAGVGVVVAETPSASEGVQAEALMIRAPAVGVFSRSETPSEQPKVEAGARVKLGDVLGYIEVMMIPHSVFSTHEGIVEDFLVEDGQPVEFGQPLVRLSSGSHPPSAQGA